MLPLYTRLIVFGLFSSQPPTTLKEVIQFKLICGYRNAGFPSSFLHIVLACGISSIVCTCLGIAVSLCTFTAMG